MESERKSWNLSGVRWWGEVRMGNTSVVNRKRGFEEVCGQDKRAAQPNRMYQQRQ